MKNYQLVASPPGKFEWRESAEVHPSPEEVLVGCRYGAIKHGTEFSMIKGTAAARGPWNPELKLHERRAALEGGSDFITVGNMVCGEVIEVGSAVTGLALGDTVFGYSTLGLRTVVHRDRVWKLPSSVHWKSALCLDPARFALAALRDAQVRIGDSVAVFGLGAIGLMTLQLAKLCGVSPVIGIDPLAARRSAAAQMGADLCIDPLKPENRDVGRELKAFCQGRGVDAVIELSASVSALQEGLRGVAFGGRVVCAAFPTPYPAGLDFGAEAHMNRPQIIFSRAASDPNREHPRWSSERIEAHCLRLITEGRLDGTAVIDRVVPYQELKEEYPRVMTDQSRAIKLGLDFRVFEEEKS